MNALVTGGTGFLGRHMVNALLQDGWTVTLLVRNKNKLNETAEHPHLKIWEGDITVPDSISGLTEKIDVIYHFAAQLGEWGLPESLFYAVNVQGTRNLLEECLHTLDLRFVFISTPGVQGKGHQQATETLPYNPPYIYEKTKCEAEKLVVDYHRAHGVSMAIVRPDFVYGPGDYRRIALYRAVMRKRFLIIGNGKSILHPTFVDDVIAGLMLIGRKKAALNEIFNIAGPEQLTVEQYIKTMASGMGVAPPRMKIPLPLGKISATFFEKISSYVGKPPFISHSKIEFLTSDHGTDISKAEKMLGFHPKYDFAKGFELTCNWARENKLL